MPKALKSLYKSNHSKKRQRESLPELLDEDDIEIARLEKLLGIDTEKDRFKSAAKLNKEYETYEGISGNFGDFLLNLDKITKNGTQYDKKQKHVEDEYDDLSTFGKSSDHVLNDEEQETSDIEDLPELTYEESEPVEDLDSSEESSQAVDEAGFEDQNTTKSYYNPVPGEDIYGRVVDPNAAKVLSGKYVPPAMRQQSLQNVENTDISKELRRQMNGLMNRLSDATKDSIIHSLQNIYRANSRNIVNMILKENVLNACGNESQLMTSLIPIYASIVAALHFVVTADIGAFIIENLCVEICNTIDGYRERKTTDANHMKGKMAANCLLIVIYLYNFRVFHHDLMNDIIDKILGSDVNKISEYEIELLLLVIDHCGFQLRGDDPVNLKGVISKLFAVRVQMSNATSDVLDINQKDDENSSGRFNYMLEALTDLKNNKSRRVQNAHMETVKSLRKWIGSVKNRELKGDASGSERSLHVSLNDLLTGDTNGRWWKAGAYWKGNVDKESPTLTDKISTISETRNSNKLSVDKESKQVNKLAEKLRMNTATRKTILHILMNSRDVHDTYEKLTKIDLKGRQDRDIIRVIIECVGIEKEYNPFYYHLLNMLCEQNRQFKTTIQFTYWDTFKVMKESDDMDVKSKRKYRNLAILSVNLIISFHLPLATLRVIDMSELNDSLTYFLQVFFNTLFSIEVTTETFEAVFDRVATSSDFSQARDGLLIYLQIHYPQQDSHVEIERKRTAMKILQSMKVLDAAKLYSKKSDCKRKREMEDEEYHAMMT